MERAIAITDAKAGHQSLCDSGHIGDMFGSFTARTAPAALIYMRAS